MEVVHDGEGILLSGVRGFSPAEYASSVHGAQARILQVLGEPLSYDDLVCYGGFAFRAAVSRRMCPSAAHPCCGFQCVIGSTRAIPRELDLYECMPGEKGKGEGSWFRREAGKAVRESIERGVPVHYGSEEDGLIVGCSDDGMRWRCIHPYHCCGTEEFWFDEVRGFAGGGWPWAVVVWRGPKDPEDLAPEGELLRDALAQAVEMWYAGEQGDQYLCGGAAYDFWVDWLDSVDRGGVEDPVSGMTGNGWCYEVLVHCRSVAGRWLRRRADGLGGTAGNHLLKAAESCEGLVGVLSEGLDCPWNLALPPERGGEWTGAMRREQADRLRRARDLDEEAVSAIGSALNAL